MKQRPTVMVALDAAQIDRDLGLEFTCNRLVEIMTQQNVFRRGWWRRLPTRTPQCPSLLRCCSNASRAATIPASSTALRDLRTRGSGVKFPGARFDVHDTQYCLQDRPDANGTRSAGFTSVKSSVPERTASEPPEADARRSTHMIGGAIPGPHRPYDRCWQSVYQSVPARNRFVQAVVGTRPERILLRRGPRKWPGAPGRSARRAKSA